MKYLVFSIQYPVFSIEYYEEKKCARVDTTLLRGAGGLNRVGKPLTEISKTVYYRVVLSFNSTPTEANMEIFLGIASFILTIFLATIFEKLRSEEEKNVIALTVVMVFGAFFGIATIGFFLSAGNDGSVVQETKLENGEVYRMVANFHNQNDWIVILLNENDRLIGCSMNDIPPKVFRKIKDGEYVPFVGSDTTLNKTE